MSHRLGPHTARWASALAEALECLQEARRLWQRHSLYRPGLLERVTGEELVELIQTMHRAAECTARVNEARAAAVEAWDSGQESVPHGAALRLQSQLEQLHAALVDLGVLSAASGLRR